MKITHAEVEKVLRLLEASPKRITAVTQHLTSTQLHTKPDPNAWSANDILAHLRACVDVWTKDIDVMLTQDSPKMRHLSPRTYMRRTNYPNLEFGPSFQIFCSQRAELLEKLSGLAFASWSRDAEIKGRQHTVFTHARRLALHEAVHCDQIEALF